jgi:hypothetical protein
VVSVMSDSVLGIRALDFEFKLVVCSLMGCGTGLQAVLFWALVLVFPGFQVLGYFMVAGLDRSKSTKWSVPFSKAAHVSQFQHSPFFNA